MFLRIFTMYFNLFLKIQKYSMQYQFLFICQKFNIIYSSKYAFLSFVLTYLPHFQSSFSLLFRAKEQFLNWLIKQVVKINKFKKKGMIARFLFTIIFLSKSEGIILRWAVFRVYFSNNFFHCLFWFISFWVYQFIYCYCPLLFFVSIILQNIFTLFIILF